ncbi:asparagine--tRNA ligase, cytoplasmic 2-like [Panicum hallii]|uniref:asparagine--tRNA ligase, cytoplasmic 2-like n=1 Tax=Panicum hallii TaxID=206008 RepID=UPI000DF4E4C3|nr:asparagine--tRNA ligase, cytoplasmic 2-like [Panicum hallii]
MASSPPSSSSSSEEATTSSNGSASVQFSKYSRRATLRSVVGRPDGGLGLSGKRAVVGGWVKSANVVKAKRGGGAMSPPRMPATETTGLTCTEVLMARVPLIRCIAKLIAGASTVDKASFSVSYKLGPVTALVRINDGSCVPDLQIVVDSSLCPLEQVTAIGASVLVEGKIELVEGKNQQRVVELRVDKVLHIGAVNIDKYPLPNVELLPPDELIKDYPHTSMLFMQMASAARVRSEMVHAAHTFFQTNGFFHVNTPIITTTTVAGDRRKMFRVMRPTSKSDNRAITPEVVRASIKAKTKQIEALERSESNKEALEAPELDLQRASELAQQLEQQGSADFSDDSFQHPLYLSPDHTLHLETYACALSSIYTFSPAFQAESLEPNKHLAERWTIDAELAFAELEDAISCAVDYLMWLLCTVSKNCSDELKFLSTKENNGKNFHINSVVSSPWERITYNEAVNTLLQVKDKSFEAKVELGMPLSLEHMSYLVDDYYKKPVIIYEYPKQLKPFYARLMEDETKVSAFDIVVPKVGIVACGTQKEERMDKLTARIDDLSLPRDQLEWYLDIRRHGTVKHSGFSMDMEQLILLVTGLDK